MIRLGLKVSEARIGVSTNREELLKHGRFTWFDTNFFGVERIPYERAKDSFFEVLDQEGGMELKVEGDSLNLSGPFSRLESLGEDLRYSIFGNLGVFSSWVLRTMEEKHNMVTFHACGLVKDSNLIIIPGGAGAGKTIFILTALEEGWKIFATEFVHLRVSGKVEFFKGALKDAVRVDTFRNHFPVLADKLGIDLREEMGSKLVVDLSAYQYPFERLNDPRVTLVFPHVEDQWNRLEHSDIRSRESLLRRLFLSAGEKIEKGALLYGRFPVSGLDTSQLAENRLKRLRDLLDSGCIIRSMSWISGVKQTRKLFHILQDKI